jgi:hypothetical protein
MPTEREIAGGVFSVCYQLPQLVKATPVVGTGFVVPNDEEVVSSTIMEIAENPLLVNWKGRLERNSAKATRRFIYNVLRL